MLHQIGLWVLHRFEASFNVKLVRYTRPGELHLDVSLVVYVPYARAVEKPLVSRHGTSIYSQPVNVCLRWDH